MAVGTDTADTQAQAAGNRVLAEQVLDRLGTEAQFDLYADDIVMEFPYGPSLGMPDRFETKPTVVAYVRRILKGLSGVVIRESWWWRRLFSHPIIRPSS